jgi:hypothetical protein
VRRSEIEKKKLRLRRKERIERIKREEEIQDVTELSLKKKNSTREFLHSRWLVRLRLE